MTTKVLHTFILALLLSSFAASSQNYKLVWEDNFEGNTLDSSIWTIEEKEGIWNTGANSEFQHYKKENVTVGDDGEGNNCLILSALKENYNNYQYTSGKVTTKGKLAFRRGKLEASIKIPDLANGLWPAFWTLGYTPIGWPDCGEIDVLEMGHASALNQGLANRYIGAHLFWGPYPRDYGTEFTAEEDLNTGYFKHTLIWDESKIAVYFNDAEEPYFSMGITGNDAEEYRDFQHYLIFNLAVGGSVPGIFDVNQITADFPANMYVDWVKIYQEEEKEDINNTNLDIFGVYGVYEEDMYTDISMTYGYDVFENTTGVTLKTGEEAYEGDQVLAYNTAAATEFNIKLTSGLLRKMSNYTEGSLQFYIKTEISDDIQIGMSDTDGNETFITFNDANENNFVRDGSWQLVYIPMADVGSAIDISKLKNLLIIKGTGTADSYISIDQVVFRETKPAKGYYGIFSDNPNISQGFEVDNVTTHMYIWGNTVEFNEIIPAYEGENSYSFKSTGAESWFGFGCFSDNPLNFSAYADGYYNISIKTTANSEFYIGMDGDGDTNNGIINFAPGSDPFEFERDGEWHHLSIPIEVFTNQGLDLSKINHVLKTGGPSTGNLAFDNVFLSDEVPAIENPSVCIAKSINITPANESVEIDEVLVYSADILNQFSKPFDGDVEWSTDGGTIKSNGVFKSDTPGEYTITATYGEISKTTTVTVTPTVGINDNNQSIETYFNNKSQQLTIKGLNANAQVSIYNTIGQITYSETINTTESTIEFNTAGKGVFIVKIESKGKIYTQKFIKQ